MTNLHSVNNQELLSELQSRIQTRRIKEEEISQLLEKEIWAKGYQEAAKDTKRWQEAQEWEVSQMNDWIKQDEQKNN
ncbi:MAG: hypothetical protein mread185_000456 [Mycoplasmataceae bacterium]|nr:MAG: hypothetical protein mread185_000456 [Mycoplasmataceae bacterium]